MANIEQADIDPSGVFKYVLIRVHSKEQGDDSEVDIVRGYGWAEYHGQSRTTANDELAWLAYMTLLRAVGVNLRSAGLICSVR